MISALAHRVGRFLSGLSGLFIAGLVLLTLLDVTRRALVGRSIGGTIEFTEVGLVAVAFLGLIGAQLNDRMIRTPVLTNRLPSRIGHAVRSLALAGSVALLIWMIVQTTQVAIDSVHAREFREGLTHVAIWPMRIVIPVGLTGLTLALCVELGRTVRRFAVNAQADIVDYENNL
jgi:TRAP-type C4-dicarboxylate transport system permease small subunit